MKTLPDKIEEEKNDTHAPTSKRDANAKHSEINSRPMKIQSSNADD